MATLTEAKLKELIVEVLNEVRIAPDYDYFATDDQITKIHSLIDSGDPENIEMAKVMIDALGASPRYFDDYMRYREVGEVEKLANKHAANKASLPPGEYEGGLDDLGDYFKELDRFEDREWKRGRPDNEPAREFYDRYKSVEDMYDYKGDLK
tara:strand:- start:2377 stop:2832 length:456 start_codon:yes stop_codon:yes gene_type:complete